MIQLRRGTFALRLSSDEILENGQPFYETDTNTVYVGDGQTRLKNLDAINNYNDNVINGEGQGSIMNGDENEVYGKWAAAFGHENKVYMKDCITLGGGNEAGKTEQEFKDWIIDKVHPGSTQAAPIYTLIPSSTDATLVYYKNDTELRIFCVTVDYPSATTLYFVLFGNSDRRWDWENYSGQALAMGDHCGAKDRGAFAGGRNSRALEDSAFAHGYNCVAKARQSQAFGYLTETNNWCESAFGKYNKSELDTLYSIGFGTNVNDRKNAFEVKNDGSIRVSVQGLTNDSIVRKDYVDNAISNNTIRVTNDIKISNTKYFIIDQLTSGIAYYGGFCVIPVSGSYVHSGMKVTMNNIRVKIPWFSDAYTHTLLKSVNSLFTDGAPDASTVLLNDSSQFNKWVLLPTFEATVIKLDKFKWYGAAVQHDISQYGYGLILCIQYCGSPAAKPLFTAEYMICDNNDSVLFNDLLNLLTKQSVDRGLPSTPDPTMPGADLIPLTRDKWFEITYEAIGMPTINIWIGDPNDASHAKCITNTFNKILIVPSKGIFIDDVYFSSYEYTDMLWAYCFGIRDKLTEHTLGF